LRREDASTTLNSDLHSP